jgi:predicted transcriptional regulator YdeE
MPIEPKQVKLPAFNLVGYSIRTDNQTEKNHLIAKIPSLWQKFMEGGICQQILTNMGKDPNVPVPVYSVYHQYESDHTAPYSVSLSLEGTQTGTEFETIQIPEQTYLVFSAQGNFAEIVPQTWFAIWQYFEDNKTIKRSFTKDFERYPSSKQVDVHIAIDLK